MKLSFTRWALPTLFAVAGLAAQAAPVPAYYDGTVVSGQVVQGRTDANSLNYPEWPTAQPTGQVGVWAFEANGNFPITVWGRAIGKNTDLAFYIFEGIFNDPTPMWTAIKNETGAERVYRDDTDVNGPFYQYLGHGGNPNVPVVPAERAAIGDKPYADPYVVATGDWNGWYTLVIGDVYPPSKNVLDYTDPDTGLPMDTSVGFDANGNNYELRICIGADILPLANAVCPTAVPDDPATLPEPSSVALAGLALAAGLGARRRRR